MAKDDAEKYNSFWKLHGKVFKLGYSDFVNRDRITRCCASTPPRWKTPTA